MPIGSIFTAKESTEIYQPLLLVELTLRDGSIKRYSTHPLSATYGGAPTAGSYEYGGNPWLPRVLNKDIGETQAMSDLGVEITPQVSVILADPDKDIFAVELSTGFKGADMRLYAVMWDAGDTATGSFSSNSPAPVKFIGKCSAPKVDEKTITITATSLLNMGQVQMPPIRIQKRCSWTFPGTLADRTSALNDAASIFSECGYSYGLIGGIGNPETGTAAFTSCNYSFDACVERLGDSSPAGGFVAIEKDQAGNATGRFGGFRWIPEQSSGKERPYLTGKWEEVINASNEARYGDFGPLAYGTTWLEPLIMGVWGDGNYTNLEVLLCYGEVNRIRKVVVNGQEVARIADDTDTGHRAADNSIPSDATTETFINGYWKTVNRGGRTGTPNPNPGWGRQGDPYGSMACIYISVLRGVAQENSVPQVQVLLEGGKVRTYTDLVTYTQEFSTNPAWVLLDLLVWGGFLYSDVDIQSFIDSAAKCDAVTFFDRMDGTFSNTYLESGAPDHKRFSVGFNIRQRISIGELIRGVRNAMKAVLFFDYNTGKLKLAIKETLASQQPGTITGSNYNTPIASTTVAGVPQNGYAAYKFDHTCIIKKDGKSSLQVYQRNNQDAANKVSVSFQNRENAFSQDTATVVDTEDVSRVGNEVFGNFPLTGVQTFDHARRVIATWMAENFRGNPRSDYEGSAIGDTGGTLVFEFEMSVKALHLVVGHLCLLSDQQLGISNQLVRVMKIHPSTNFETAKITAAWHNDNWYQDSFGQTSQPKYTRARSIVDRKPFAWRPGYQTPAVGDTYYSQTDLSFGLMQLYETAADNTVIAKLRITGKVPVNAFPDTPGRPKLELTGVGATGGGYTTDKTYYVALAAKGLSGSATLLSAASTPAVISLEDPKNALQFVVQNWPDSPSGYIAFVGHDPFSMTYQDSGTSSPSSIVLTNGYNDASWGAPDEALANFRWRVRRELHAGVWGQEITAATTSSISVSVFDNYGFTTNEWAGREVSVFGIVPGDTPTQTPIANFQVASNNSATLTLTSGNPLTCVNGGPLAAGDVVVMRIRPTFGEDGNGKYFEDLEFVNVLNPISTTYAITDATNATPIVLTISVPLGDSFPFDNGDTVVVQGVLGTTAANGGWVVANRNTVAKTFELQGGVGNADYTGGGTVGEQVQGLGVDEERGRVVFIIAGTGRGTLVRIKSNTATRIYIDGDWPVAPDSTSRLVILEPVYQVDLPSGRISNKVPELETTFDVDVNNYLNQTLFVQVPVESVNGELSYEVLDPFREIYLFGQSEDDSGDITINGVRVQY